MRGRTVRFEIPAAELCCESWKVRCDAKCGYVEDEMEL